MALLHQQWRSNAGILLRGAGQWAALWALAWGAAAGVLELDGRGSYAALPDGLGGDLSEMTVEFRVRWDHLGYYDSPVHFGDTVNAVGWNHQDTGVTTPVVFVQPGSPAPLKAVADGVIRPGEWMHLATTFGPQGIELYVNGRRLASMPCPVPSQFLATAPARWLGRSPWAQNGYFRGALDDLCIWRRALGPSEIEARRSAPVPAEDPDLLAAWTFETVAGSPGAFQVPAVAGSGMAAVLHGGARIGPGEPWREQPFWTPLRLHGRAIAPQPVPEAAEFRLWREGTLLRIGSFASDGRLDLALVEAPGSVELEVTRGVFGGRRRIEVVPGGEFAVDVPLRPARSVFGRVTTRNGSPQAGVEIVAWPEWDDGGKAERVPLVARVRSDSQGHYQFINLRPGRYRVTCGEGSQPWELEATCPAETTCDLHEGEELRLPDFRLPRLVGRRIWTPESRPVGSPDREIAALATDRKGRLWMGTALGLVLRDTAGTRVWRQRDGLPSDKVTALALDASQRLWVGTALGLAILGDGRLEAPSGPGVPSADVTSLVLSGEGAIWVGTQNGLARWFQGRWTWFGGDSGLPSSLIRNIHHHPGGPLVVTTAGGSAVFNGEGFDQVTNQAGIQGLEGAGAPWRGDGVAGDVEFPQIWRERLGGESWAAWDSRLYCRTDRRWHAINWGPGSRGDSEVLSLMFDDSGILWLGTRSWGLIRGEVPASVTFNEEDGLPGRGVTCTERTPDGSVWIGTREGLARLRSGTLESWTPESGLPARVVHCLHADRSGRLWIGTDRGLLTWNASGFVHAAGGGGFQVRSVSEGPDGTLWCATAGEGVLHWRPGNGAMRRFGSDRGFWEGHLTSVMASSDGSVWYTQDFSVTRVTDSAVLDYVLTRSATSNDSGVAPFGVTVTNRTGRHLSVNATSTSALAEDAQGAVWVGTWRQGLLRQQEGRWTHFPPDSGLDSPDVRALCIGPNGRLWCGTSTGVRVFDGEHWGTLGTASGLSDGPVNHIRADPDGTLWFATEEGVTRLRPPEVRPAPPILEMELGSESVASKAAPLVRVGEPLPLTFRRPAGYRIRWRVATPGAVPEWSAPTDATAVSWRPTQPGRVRIEALVLDSFLNQSEVATRVVSAVWPWYRHPGVLGSGSLLAFSAFGMAGWIGWRGRRSRMEAERLRREAEVRDARDRSRAQFAREILNVQESERRRLAHELHDSLGQELLLIRNTALLAAKRSQGPAGPLADIAERASRTIEEVRTIAYALRPQELDRLGLVRALETLCQEMGETGGLQVDFSVEPGLPPLPPETQIGLYRVAQEALSNVLRHARARRIRCDIQALDGGWCVMMADDGVGFPVSPDPMTREGLGLLGMHERVRLCGGVLEIHSSPGTGTRLTIRLPAAPRGPSNPSPDSLP